MPPHLLRVKGQRGQVLAYLAVVAPLLLLPLTAYVIEVTRLAAAQARLEAVAATTAEDAVQQIDVSSFRSGGGLRPDAAAAAATAKVEVTAREPGAAVDGVTVTGASLALQVSEPVPLVFAGFLGASTVRVHARALATLKAGY